MSELSISDWTGYSVSQTGSQQFDNQCRPLTHVWHVSHVLNAIDIVEANQLRPQLIFDNSRLNTQRVLVVWFSPNDWTNAGGSRYGNVGFEADWKTLIKGKKYYWVGAMDEYTPTACRILITIEDRSKELVPYDASRKDGPWWHDTTTDEHFWNGEYCLEFMIEREIQLSEISQVKFFKHHLHRCSIDPRKCEDKGHESAYGAARFLAGLCNRNLLHRIGALLTKGDEFHLTPMYSGWYQLIRTLTSGTKQMTWDGHVESRTSQAAVLLRLALQTVLDQRETDRLEVLKLFRSEDDVVAECARLFEKDLGIGANTLPCE